MLASPQFKNTEELPSLVKASNKIIEQLDLLMQTQQRKSLGGEGIKRIETYTSMQDPLLWLHSQKADKKTFWRGRDGEENIAINKTHIHWKHLRPYVISHPEITFMLFHFSLKYKDEEIKELMESEFKKDNIKNVELWLSDL